MQYKKLHIFVISICKKRTLKDYLLKLSHKQKYDKSDQMNIYIRIFIFSREKVKKVPKQKIINTNKYALM